MNNTTKALFFDFQNRPGYKNLRNALKVSMNEKIPVERKKELEKNALILLEQWSIVKLSRLGYTLKDIEVLEEAWDYSTKRAVCFDLQCIKDDDAKLSINIAYRYEKICVLFETELTEIKNTKWYKLGRFLHFIKEKR